VAAAIAAAAPELARLALDLCDEPLLHAAPALLNRCKSEVTRLALMANNAFLDGNGALARALAGQALRISEGASKAAGAGA
jgi:hypothetical protein